MANVNSHIESHSEALLIEFYIPRILGMKEFEIEINDSYQNKRYFKNLHFQSSIINLSLEKMFILV